MLKKATRLPIWALLGAALLLGFVIMFVIMRQPTGTTNSINTYEECIAAGNPSLDSLPPQCETKSGDRFMKDL